MALLKILYSILIGILLTSCVGFGLESFYPAPDVKYSQTSITTNGPSEPTNQNDLITYSRNTFLVSQVVVLLFVVITIFVVKALPVIQGGFLFGGIFTFLLTVMRMASSYYQQDRRFEFGGVVVLLLIVLFIAYYTFSPKRSATKTK